MRTLHADQEPGSNRGEAVVRLVLLASAMFLVAATRAESASGESSAFALDTRIVGESASYVLGTGTIGISADSGTGSLRDSIAGASPGDTLTFDPSLDGLAITLGGTQLTIGKNLTISAAALPCGVTVSGNNASRIFEILSGNTLNLEKLTVSDGNAASGPGGGILNSNGVLTVNNAVICANSAMSGGALHNTGSVTMIDTVLSGNTASGGGGAIFNDGGFLNLSNVLISDNVAAAGGGGILSESGGQETLINGTLTGNSASDGGGVRNHSGILTLVNATLAGNSATGFGGGLDIDGGQLNIENTIVAANSGPSPGNGPDIGKRGGSTVVPSGANLIGNNDSVGDNFSVGPLVGGPGGNLAPLLAPLGHYGGAPATMALLAGSPAIDSGITTFRTPFTDQRGSGFGRVRGLALDIGAYETGNEAGYAIWAMERIPSGKDSSFQGDAEQDGIRNGDEYGLLLDPSKADTALRPSPGLVDIGGSLEMRVIFPFRPDAVDLRYIIDRSTDLQLFDEIYRYDTGTGAEAITGAPAVSATINVNANEIEVIDTNTAGPLGFWRLRAELVAP